MPRLLRGKYAARDWAALALLARVALDDAGWRWGGVGGWQLYDDVADAVPERVSEVLPHLTALGLAQRVDVRAPGLARATWMYRVTEAGLRLLAARDECPVPALPPAGEDPDDAGTFFVPRRMWPAFTALQARSVKASNRGWATLYRLAAAGARLDSGDVDWLVRCGLVERRPTTPADGPGSWAFRATAAGRRLVRTAPASAAWVRVRVAPAGAPELPLSRSLHSYSTCRAAEQSVAHSEERL